MKKFLFLISAFFCGAAHAATITYLPGTNSQSVAEDIPGSSSVWTGIAQSVTAVDTNVSFGFYLFGASSSPVLYSLYAGDGVSGTALEQVLVTSPVADGFHATLALADFSSVTLTVGEKYTFVASLPGGGLPAIGTSSVASAAYAGLDNPYADGRFYFTGASYNESLPAFADRDLAFSMTGTSPSAVPETASWCLFIAGAGMMGAAMRRRAPLRSAGAA